MQRYRAGLANILGEHALLGYLQLGMAATFSPSLTTRRLQRIAQFRRVIDANHQDGISSAATDSGEMT